MLPRFPGQIRLRFAHDEAPVDRADFFFFRDGQNRVKGATHRARHEFRANHRPAVFFQPANFAFEIFGPAVVMKRDHVRFSELDLFDFAEVGPVRGLVHAADSAGERLGGIDFARPFECFG